jgi:3-oxoacyl-[acyl-carrier protein] reductase
MSLQGKIAVVTGGSRGIGRCISERLGSAGAFVIVNYVSRPEAAQEVIEAIREKGGDGKAVRFNVSAGGEVNEAFAGILEEHGRIDILVNNAGITRDGLMLKMKDEQWDEVIDTNLKGVFLCSRAVYRAMMKQRWGRIVNITSVIGFAGNAGQVNYAAAKAGIIGLTRSMARELAPRGVTVNGVAPGYITTDMTSGLSEEITAKIKGERPLGILGEPEDVAGAVGYLVSEEAGYVTGQFIHVNGGMFMG